MNWGHINLLIPTNLLNKASGVLINASGRKKRDVGNSDCETICDRIKRERSKINPDDLSISIGYKKCLKECPIQN